MGLTCIHLVKADRELKQAITSPYCTPNLIFNSATTFQQPAYNLNSTCVFLSQQGPCPVLNLPRGITFQSLAIKRADEAPAIRTEAAALAVAVNLASRNCRRRTNATMACRCWCCRRQHWIAQQRGQFEREEYLGICLRNEQDAGSGYWESRRDIVNDRSYVCICLRKLTNANGLTTQCCNNFDARKSVKN
jgi:hypothetical protein